MEELNELLYTLRRQSLSNVTVRLKGLSPARFPIIINRNYSTKVRSSRKKMCVGVYTPTHIFFSAIHKNYVINASGKWVLRFRYTSPAKS